MRSLVCAQCHVEYYFIKSDDPNNPGRANYLMFPHDKGLTCEAAEEYYDSIGFYDYIHPLSKTPILKAQHTGYEMARQGIHGQRGVSCADCHMPYKQEGGVKYALSKTFADFATQTSSPLFSNFSGSSVGPNFLMKSEISGRTSHGYSFPSNITFSP